jgi:four helix bundle protein
MNPERRNNNRGYQQLYVWQDAIELYGLSCRAVSGWAFEYKKIASQAISSTDSVHRNIAEGYCRRTVKEYLQHLNVALGSLGETLSGFIAYHRNEQITASDFEEIDSLIFRLENRLLKLVESLERRRDSGDWTETLIVSDETSGYGTDSTVANDFAIFIAHLS